MPRRHTPLDPARATVHPTQRPGEEILYLDHVLQVPWLGRRARCVYTLDMRTHPLRDVVIAFLLRDPNLTASSILRGATSLRLLGQFLVETGRGAITAESFHELLGWLENQRGVPRGRERERRNPEAPRPPLSEPARRQTAEAAIQLYAFGLSNGWPGYEQATLDDIADRKVDYFRDRHLREAESKARHAVSTTEYRRLLRACRMEMEACEQALREAERTGTVVRAVVPLDRFMDPNPFVLFAILAALEMGLRSSEFNTASLSDMEHKPEFLFAHASNKPPRYLRLTPQVARALDLALRWSAPLRAEAEDPTPLLLFQIERFRNRPTRGIRPVSTQQFNNGWLRRFYRKYFERTEVQDGEERPVLYADPKKPGDIPVPVHIPYMDLRAVGLTEFARLERNKDIVRRHAGHANLITTELHYLHQAEESRLSDTSHFLLPAAEKLRMVMENEVVDDPDSSTRERLILAGALIPGGHCQDALETAEQVALDAGFRVGCTRALDCRLCINFRIHVGRREFFVAERDTALTEAQRFQADEGKLRDAQNLREFAALNEAVVARIDEHLERVSQ